MAWNSLRDNPISNAILGHPEANSPGVPQISASNPSQLVHDTQTGMYYDPTTGNTYSDPNGQNPVADPNLAQQVAQNFATSQSFLNQLQPYQQAERNTIGMQGDLAQVLRDRVAGKGASIAGMQLQQGLNNIASEQQSQAAGISGASAPLAAMLAMRNTGQASIGANNSAAIARAKEEQDAATALSTLLAQRAGAANAAQNTNITGGLGFANIANSGQQTQQDIDAKAAAARAASAEKFGYALLKGISSGTPYGTKNPVLGDSSGGGGGGDQPNATSASGDSAGGGIDNLGQGAAAYAAFA